MLQTKKHTHSLQAFALGVKNKKDECYEARHHYHIFDFCKKLVRELKLGKKVPC